MVDAIVFNMTFTCIICIACNLFVLELNDSLNMDIAVALVDLAVVLGLTFAYFYLSEWISAYLLEIGDVFYDSLWYRWSLQQQRLLVLPIQRSQREFRLKSLGLFDCSLAFFASVSIFHKSPINHMLKL